MGTLIWGLDKFKDQAIETRHIMDCEEEKKIYLDSKMVVQDRGDQYICAKRWPYIYGHCLPLWALKSLLHPTQVTHHCHSSTHPHHSHCTLYMCSVHCNQLPNILSITFLFNYYYNHIQEVYSCQILYTTLTFRIRGLWNPTPLTLISHGLWSLFRYIDIHIYYILMWQCWFTSYILAWVCEL